MASKISVFRNTSYPVTYNHTDSAGAAVSLVNKRLYFTVKETDWDDSANDSSAQISKVVPSEDHTDAAGGITGFTLTDLDLNLEPNTYYYAFIIEDETTGLSEPPSVYGEFEVLAQPTNKNVGNEA
jgi:hypothetical protein